MKPLHYWTRANSNSLNFFLCIIVILLYSCGGGGGSGDSSDTGAVSFNLVLQDQNTTRAWYRQASNSRAAQFECVTDDYAIETIDAEIKDKNGNVVAAGGPFDCAAGKGSVDEIEPGSNYRVYIFARDSEGFIIFEGQSDPFSVNAGEMAQAGVITLRPVNTPLNGDFRGTGFGIDRYSYYFPWSVLFDATFNGDGTGFYAELANSEEDFESGPLTYDLKFDGSLTATLPDGTKYDGILNDDANIIAVADTDFEDDFIEMDVAIKKSIELSDAILIGDYIGVRINSDPSTTRTLFNFAGDGSGSFQVLASSNGGLNSGKLTYEVGSEGDVMITDPGAVASEGIVSGDGAVISLVDTVFRGSNENLDMTVLIKTSSGLSDATIDGDYVAVSFVLYTGDSYGIAETTVWSINADGVGNMDFEIIVNSSGASDTIDTTYRVDDTDGSVQIGPQGDPLFDGIVNAKGDVFTFVDTNNEDNKIEMGVAIRKRQ